MNIMHQLLPTCLMLLDLNKVEPQPGMPALNSDMTHTYRLTFIFIIFIILFFIMFFIMFFFFFPIIFFFYFFFSFILILLVVLLFVLIPMLVHMLLGCRHGCNGRVPERCSELTSTTSSFSLNITFHMRLFRFKPAARAITVVSGCFFFRVLLVPTVVVVETIKELRRSSPQSSPV